MDSLIREFIVVLFTRSVSLCSASGSSVLWPSQEKRRPPLSASTTSSYTLEAALVKIATISIRIVIFLFTDLVHLCHLFLCDVADVPTESAVHPLDCAFDWNMCSWSVDTVNATLQPEPVAGDDSADPVVVVVTDVSTNRGPKDETEANTITPEAITMAVETLVTPPTIPDSLNTLATTVKTAAAQMAVLTTTETTIPVVSTTVPVTKVPVVLTTVPTTKIPLVSSSVPATKVPLVSTTVPSTKIPVVSSSLPATTSPSKITITSIIPPTIPATEPATTESSTIFPETTTPPPDDISTETMPATTTQPSLPTIATPPEARTETEIPEATTPIIVTPSATEPLYPGNATILRISDYDGVTSIGQNAIEVIGTFKEGGSKSIIISQTRSPIGIQRKNQIPSAPKLGQLGSSPARSARSHKDHNIFTLLASKEGGSESVIINSRTSLPRRMRRHQGDFSWRSSVGQSTPRWSQPEAVPHFRSAPVTAQWSRKDQHDFAVTGRFPSRTPAAAASPFHPLFVNRTRSHN